MTRTPDEIKRNIVTCMELNVEKFMPGATQKALADALALIQQLQEENAEKDARIQQLEAERDAAVKDMHRSCFICKNFGRSECLNTVCAECVGWCNWEWRGVQKEDGNAKSP